MKAKNLFLLVLALVVLAGLAKWTRGRPAGRAAPATAQKLVAFDVNASDAIAIASASQTTELARVGETWVVKSLWNYPADFRIMSENVRRLAELEGLPVRGGEQNLAEFGLEAGATNNAPGSELAVLIFSGSGKELGRLALGAPRLSKGEGEMGGYPNGQYMRAGSGPVLVVKEFMGGLPRRPQDWVGKDLVAVSRSDLDYVMVQSTNGVQYGLLADTNGVFTLSDLKAGEVMKKETADDVAGALQSLSLVNVLDPKAPAGETGLSQPSTYVAKLKNGLTYTLKIGGVSAADNGRIVQLAVAHEKTAPPAANTNAPAPTVDFAQQAATENARLAPWTFVVSDYAAGNLLKPRGDLVQAPTNAPAATNPPPADASTAAPPPVSAAPAAVPEVPAAPPAAASP